MQCPNHNIIYNSKSKLKQNKKRNPHNGLEDNCERL